MENPTGEPNGEVLRLSFDRRLMLQFRGSVVTQDCSPIGNSTTRSALPRRQPSPNSNGRLCCIGGDGAQFAPPVSPSQAIDSRNRATVRVFAPALTERESGGSAALTRSMLMRQTGPVADSARMPCTRRAGGDRRARLQITSVGLLCGFGGDQLRASQGLLMRWRTFERLSAEHDAFVGNRWPGWHCVLASSSRDTD
jgi:hypothetical protein